MIIKSLEKMETIVSKSKSLYWDGWDVVSIRPMPTAWSRKDGIFIKGRWYTQRRYPITENGWDIPSKIVG